MRVTKSDISLELECWVEELTPVQLAQYEKVANEHNAIKNALKNALSSNEGKELFAGQVFQAYSFKGKVLQELKEATVPKKPPKAADSQSQRGRKRNSNYVYLESSDEEEDDVPLAKRIAMSSGKKGASHDNAKGAANSSSKTPLTARQKAAATGKASPLPGKSSKSSAQSSITIPTSPVNTPTGKNAKNASATSSATPTVRPSESTAIGGLVIGNDKDSKDKDGKDSSKETKLQGKTFPSLVVLAKPWLKVKDMSATRSKLDSKVKLVLMLTPNKFTEWLIQEGLLKAEQRCANHRNNELKLGVFSDATKFPFTGGYVWISECCPMRLVSVFHGSIFEGAPHPPSCILKLIYHWSCQTNIQNVVQWVKVDNVYIKGVYTWLRAICTLAVQQKCLKLGGPDKFVEVGVISLGTTSQDGQQRQVKVEVLGVLDHAEKTIRLRAVEPLADGDRNYKRRFQTILEPLQRWVHKQSVICIDLTVDRLTLYSMGFENIVQAAATDNTAKHTNSAVMDYLRRIVPRMFQNTLSLLSRQMIQQFLDELVWREHFGTYALQAFNSITSHIAEQTRMNTAETLTQRLYQVATNPFKDWSVLPTSYKETPPNTQPKRLKKPINEADYLQPTKLNARNVKKEKDSAAHDKGSTTSSAGGRRRGASSATSVDDDYRPDKKSAKLTTPSSKTSTAARGGAATNKSTPSSSTKKTPVHIEAKNIKKEEDDLKGLEEMYYGVRDGNEDNFEAFPFNGKTSIPIATTVDCPICDINESYDSNEKLQTHLVSHIIIDGKDHQFQCLFCLEKHASEPVLSKHNQIMHPSETKTSSSASYHCLICQNRFNSLHYLTSHLQKMHSMLELPYSCQACAYRSSSQRDVVRHFYDDHKNQNFLQCPFCLDIFRFCYRGQINITNIENYYMHLRQHVSKKDVQLRCQKCALSFIEKGALKQHLANHHGSLLRNATNVRKLLKNSLLIQPPKVRSHHREPLPFTVQLKYGDFYAYTDGKFCAECNSEIINENHFIGELKCNKCHYKTCCERAMFEHSSDCGGINSARDVLEMPLPNEMHCICGFSSAIGNKMAQHLAVCGQKSAYPSHEIAQENLVKRNMLDMLGLVRRDGETGADSEETSENADFGGDSTEVSEQPQDIQDTQDTEDTKESKEQLAGNSNTDEQTPIQFGEMEAAPVVESDQTLSEPVESDEPQNQPQENQKKEEPQPKEPQPQEEEQKPEPQPQEPQQQEPQQQEPQQQEKQQQETQQQEQEQQQPQLEMQTQEPIPEPEPEQQHQQEQEQEQQQPDYTISFEPPGDVSQTQTEIDMPLIADLADPNPPATPQFLGDVHTPMFDAVAAAEQQHFYQQSTDQEPQPQDPQLG